MIPILSSYQYTTYVNIASISSYYTATHYTVSFVKLWMLCHLLLFIHAVEMEDESQGAWRNHFPLDTRRLNPKSISLHCHSNCGTCTFCCTEPHFHHKNKTPQPWPRFVRLIARESVTVTDNKGINQLCSTDADRQTDSWGQEGNTPGARRR